MRIFPGFRSLWTMFCSLSAFIPLAGERERKRETVSDKSYVYIVITRK